MRFLRAILPSVMLAGSCTLIAGDYDELAKTLKANWPERKSAVVVCDLELSRFAVADLATAARAVGISLQAVNVKADSDVDRAKSTINGMRPDLVVLIESDPILGLQGKHTKSFVSNASNRGIPSVGINSEILKVGGVLAIGTKTAGKLIASASLIRSLRLKTPEGATLQ